MAVHLDEAPSFAARDVAFITCEAVQASRRDLIPVPIANTYRPKTYDG
jgi:hypothetical protein